MSSVTVATDPEISKFTPCTFINIFSWQLHVLTDSDLPLYKVVGVVIFVEKCTTELTPHVCKWDPVLLEISSNLWLFNVLLHPVN